MMVLLQNRNHDHLTKSEIARRMSKSPSLVTPIYQKLKIIGVIGESIDDNIKGTSKNYLTIRLADLLQLLGNECGYIETQQDELLVDFENWIEKREQNFDFSILESSGLITFFDDKIYSDIAKKVPTFFFYMIMVAYLMALLLSNTKIEEQQILSLFSLANPFLYFTINLSLQLLADILTYLKNRLLSPYGQSLVKRILNSQNLLLSDFNSILSLNQDFDKNQLHTSLRQLQKQNQSPKYWSKLGKQLSIKPGLNNKDLQNIDTNKELVVIIPLKDGTSKTVTIPAIIALEIS